MTRTKTAFAALVLGVVAALAMVAAPATAQDATKQVDPMTIDTTMIPDMSMGKADAPVTVIEYASFTCPHCAAFHANSWPTLKTDYIDTGKVHFIYREVYFDRPGLWASIVARCGPDPQARFFGIVDMLFNQQLDWARQKDATSIVDALRKIGKAAGLTDAELDTCLTDGENAQRLYARYLQLAKKDNVQGTPTFIINGTEVEGDRWDEVKATIDKALAGG